MLTPACPQGLRCTVLALGGVLVALGTGGGCSEETAHTEHSPLFDGSADSTLGIDVTVTGDGALDADAADGSPAPLGPSPFGAKCDSDADCASGLFCLLAESDVWLGGGPAHGYCSLDCTDDPNRCSSVDRYAHCLTSSKGDRDFCFKSCVLGNPSGTDKCDDRQEVSCVFVGLSPVCLPNCGGDADCPTGRYCNHTDGVCVQGNETGDPVGTDCIPGATNTCNAYCSSVGNGLGVCSGLCVLGADYACGVAKDQTELAGLPVCLSFNPLDGAGDAGICVQRCRCNEDCGHPAAYCDFDRPEASGELGLCLFDFEAEAGTRGISCGALADAGTADGG